MRMDYDNLYSKYSTVSPHCDLVLDSLFCKFSPLLTCADNLQLSAIKHCPNSKKYFAVMSIISFKI